jgi:hypothetical protein
MDPAEPVTARAYAGVAAALARRPPRARAAVAAAVSAPVLRALTAHWLGARSGRGGTADLAELEVHLHRARVSVPDLTGWADSLGRFARRHIESALGDRDPALAADWRALRQRKA